ncbi:MAG: ATP-binding protein [Nannocystaceae bacterium]|nr:ATP-binding protein [bacterium]
MAGPAVDGVDDALDELVNQFSDPLSFLRELVQNAIDAGSHEVEISTSFETKGDAGVSLIEVCDWGGGMTREIIETKLTRLFSSQKDGDRTKIGKFGIGFVSVFALGPDVVCVDTARDGEAWRVLFDAQRTFKLLRLDEPIEGTRIRVYKTMTPLEFEVLARGVRKTVRYWCKHARCDIRVDGESISVPFAFSEPCSVEHDDGYSRVSACHPLDQRTFLGLYNGGLTLVERTEADFANIAVRAWSPHLEHTLTRDAVIEDAGYERVMRAITDTIDGPLARRAFERLDAELRQTLPSTLRDYHLRCAGWHLSRGLPDETLSAVRNEVVALSTAGAPLTLGTLLGGVRDDLLFLSRVPGPLSEAVEARGHTVAHGALETGDGQLLKIVGQRGGFGVDALVAHWALPLKLGDDVDPAPYARLGDATLRVFKEAGHKVSEVLFGHFDYPGSSLGGAVAIAQKEPFSLMPKSEVKTLGEGLFAWSRPVIVNADHKATAAIVRLADRDLALAAFMLAKLFFVGAGLTPSIDGALATAAARLEVG